MATVSLRCCSLNSENMERYLTFALNQGGKNWDFRKKILFTLRLTIKAVIISIIITFFSIFINLIATELFEINIYQNFKSLSQGYQVGYSTLSMALLTGLVAPIIEELVFRLPLIVNKVNISIWIFVSIFYFGNGFASIWHVRDFPTILFVIAIFCSTLPLFFDFVLFYFKKFNLQIAFILILSFGLAHIANFKPINYNFILLYIIAVLPQIIYGLVLSYIRILLGSIIWCIISHILINSFSYFIDLYKYLISLLW